MNRTTNALLSITTALSLAACSTNPIGIDVSTLGEQPTIEQINADNDTSFNLAGTSGGLGRLVIRKIYDSNQNGKFDAGEAGIPSWGVRITSLFDDGTPSQVSDIQVTPEGAARWRGVVLNVIYGKYIVEELEPVGTRQTGLTWKITGEKSKVVNVTPEVRARAVEFTGACLENGTVVAFPKLKDFYDWKCRARFDLLPRISNFLASLLTQGSSSLAWNVLDYSKLEIDPGVGEVTALGFAASKSVSAVANQVFTLKATNGFGSSIAKVTVTAPTQGFVGEAGKWSLVGRTDRLYLKARTLPSGKVFLQGGSSRGLLDPSTGATRALPDSFNDGLAISGSKIVYGSTVEDLETGQTGTLPFVLPTATNDGADVLRLSDTKVFGIKKEFVAATGELAVPPVANIYDLSTKTIKPLNGLPGLDFTLNLTKLRDGRIAYITSRKPNGSILSPTSLVIVNPETGTFFQSKTWEQTCGALVPVDLFELSTGDLIFAGGVAADNTFVRQSCIFRQSSQTLEKLAAGDFTVISGGPLFALTSGSALKVGPSQVQTEFFNLATEQFIAGPSRTVVRRGEVFTQLLDGRVLALGGLTGSNNQPVAALEIELFTP